MSVLYFLTAVTVLYAFFFIADRIVHHPQPQLPPSPQLPPLRQVLAQISRSIKGCIRMNVDFALQLGLALSVSMLIAHTEDRYSGHSIMAGTYAAATSSASFLILEFISWEWCQCLTKQ